MESDYEIFKIKLFNDDKKYIQGNSVVAILLTVLLIVIALVADSAISDEWIVVPIIGLSVLPASVTLLALWVDASQHVTPMKRRADDLEIKALKL